MVEKYKFMSRIFFAALSVQLYWSFVCTDILPALDSTRNYINLLIDMLYIVMGVVTLRSRHDVIVFGSFVLIALTSAFLNHQSVFFFVNGFREFIGFLFIAPILRYFLNSKYADRFVQSFDKQLYIFLVIQIPCLASQFIRFGACDAGGGSLGYGASGTISTLIYVLSFYFMNKRWDERYTYLQNLIKNRDLIILLFPTFLNETKVSFLYFIGYFVLLMKVDRRFVMRLVLSTPVIAILFVILSQVYLTATDSRNSSYDEDYFTEYLIGDDLDHLVELAMMVQEEDIETDNLWVVDLPRYGRFLIMPEVMSSTGGGMLLGAGIGQFKGGSLVDQSDFAIANNWFLQGSLTMLFFILIELGIIGLCWMLYTLVSLIFTPDQRPRTENMRLYMLMIMALVIIYNPQYIYSYNCILMFYVYMRGLQPATKKIEAENER